VHLSVIKETKIQLMAPVSETLFFLFIFFFLFIYLLKKNTALKNPPNEQHILNMEKHSHK